MKKLIQVMIIALILVLLATPVIASSIENARWYGLITVSNNSTATTNIATTANISTENLIAGNFLNSEADNCVVRSSSGADIAFQPGYTDANPWAFWVSSIGANSYLTYILYTANSTGGDLSYFPNAGGMTTTDNETLELGDNFTVEQKGWFNTDNGTDKNLVFKDEAFRTYVSPTVSGNITSEIGTFPYWVSPTGFVDGGGWNNEPLVYDENTATNADQTIPATSWGNFLTLTHTANQTANCDRIRFWAFYGGANDINSIDVDVYDGAVKTDVYQGAFASLEWVTKTFTAQVVSSAQVRFYNDFGAGNAEEFYEFDFGETVFASVTALGVSSDNHTVKTTTKPVLDFVPGNLDYVSVDDHDDFSFTDGNDLPFTIIAWINLDDATDDDLVTKLALVPSRYEWRFLTLNTDNLTFITYLADGTAIVGRRTAAITGYEGSYTHFAGTYDGSELAGGFNIYINSVDSDINDLIVGAYTGMTNTNAEVNIGARDFGSLSYADGRFAEVKIYARELSPAEIASDFNGQHSSTDLVGWWMLDEGTGNSLADNSGNLHTATNHGADWVVADPLAIYIDDDLMDLTDMTAVPPNAANWAFVENYSMMYLEYQEIIIDTVQAQYIEWEYDAVFYDQSANDNDATPTFRSASSDADVSANMTAFLAIAEAQAPDYALGIAPDFIDADALTGNVTAPFTTVPPTGGFPLAGVIAAVATATDTPPQLPLLLIAVFIILAASLSMSAMMRKSGSGSLIFKIIVITAFMGIFIALQNFGIDFWMLCVFLVIAVAMGMASRHTSWT